MKKETLVSICCVTYNHERYLSQCLEGFLMQKTNFKFEILVHEDASTDKTATILKEYEEKYPHFFRCVYQTENQFYKQNVLTDILFPMAKGKFIALCEGDDYWTDPYKLQKQIDFLEKHPEVTICGHEIAILNSGKISCPVKRTEKYVSFNDELKKTNFSTLSLVFRNTIIPLPRWFYNLPQGDWGLKLIQLNKGKGYFIKDCMAVYRQHEGGIWSNQKPKELHTKVLKAYRIFLNAFPKRKKEIQFAIIKYKLKHKLFFKDLNLYTLTDFLLLIKFGFLKMIK